MKYSLILLFLLVGCSANSDLEKSSFVQPEEKNIYDGKYDSFYPTDEVSTYLEEIIKSVKMINSLAFYEVYLFDKKLKITKETINHSIEKNNFISKTDFTNTASGTATIIFSENKKVGLLTCAHIVDMADTIITYFREADGTGTDFIESFSVKKSQSNYVVEFPGSGNINLIASDRTKDIAYLGSEFREDVNFPFPQFNYSIGEAKDLNWGTFTYVFGYPLNYRMISKAIVSSPTKGENGSFLLDAVFNRGMSGGLILALRDGVPNFELVGIVQAVPGEREFLLVPPKKNSKLGYNSSIPYKGEIYVEEFKNLKYGITKVVTINSILDFFSNHQDSLMNKGFFPAQFLSK